MLTFNASWNGSMAAGKAFRGADRLLDNLQAKSRLAEVTIRRGDDLQNPVWLGSKLLTVDRKQVQSVLDKTRPIFPAIKADVASLKNDPLALNLLAANNVSDRLNQFTASLGSIERLLYKPRASKSPILGAEKPLKEARRVKKRIKLVERYRFSLTIVAIFSVFVVSIFMSVLVTFNNDNVANKR